MERAGGTARVRPVAIGLGVRRRQGREREEKREREIKLIQKFEFFSKIPFET